MPITIAVDAMGGDHAPGEIVAGAIQAAEELDVRVLLVGLEDAIAPLLPDGIAAASSSCRPPRSSAMHDPPASVRTQEGLVDRASAPSSCATARPTRMVSAGNTGATMAAALLRMGRIKGVARPAIAVPIPVPGPRAADPGRRRRHRRLHRRVARASSR